MTHAVVTFLQPSSLPAVSHSCVSAPRWADISSRCVVTPPPVRCAFILTINWSIQRTYWSVSSVLVFYIFVWVNFIFCFCKMLNLSELGTFCHAAEITFQAYVTLLVIFLSQVLHGAGIRAATCSGGSGVGGRGGGGCTANQLAGLNKMGESPRSCQGEKFDRNPRDSFDRHWAERESLPISPCVVIELPWRPGVYCADCLATAQQQTHDVFVR